MQELIAILFLLIICLAFWGYGAMILEWLSKPNDFGSGVTVAIGISAFILTCGYFELFHLVTSFFLYYAKIRPYRVLIRIFKEKEWEMKYGGSHEQGVWASPACVHPEMDFGH
jgi:hypothetical protein